MAILQYIKTREGSRRVTLGLSDGDERFELSVCYELYGELGAPARGEELDGEALASLREEDTRYRALRHALYLLSFADNSRARLLQKLRAKGYAAEAARYAVDEAVRLGYIKEHEQLRRKITVLANDRLYGARRIVSTLAARGYRAADVREVLTALRAEREIDFSENFRRLCEKKGDGTEDGQQRLRHTYGYGDG